VLVVPSSTALRFLAEDTLVLFGYSDRACQERLNLFREENA
jgi:gentisate 1,2-dioxygenase